MEFLMRCRDRINWFRFKINCFLKVMYLKRFFEDLIAMEGKFVIFGHLFRQFSWIWNFSKCFKVLYLAQEFIAYTRRTDIQNFYWSLKNFDSSHIEFMSNIIIPTKPHLHNKIDCYFHIIYKPKKFSY